MWQSLILPSLVVLVVSPPGHPDDAVRGPALMPGARLPLSQVISSNAGTPPVLRIAPEPAAPPGVMHGGVIHGPAAPPTGPQRVIVELAAEPAALARRSGRDASGARRGLNELRADLAALAGTVSPASGQTFEITREYTEVFAGAAVTIPPSWVGWLRSRAYVMSVFPDDTVRATLHESVPLIGARRVVEELNGTGVGIRVGIVDTGVDYHHVALGGGFGPGYRVAGGWDFANDDSDPLDDHGHGTHVAGIVAGNGGGVVGVAPAATLYAFKVLNSSGYGLDSDVLAGLDRVLDPDGNPLTNDAAHVINLSLGGIGHADDPLSRALDQLSELGVVCIVAAGNGYSYFSIGSPGTSRRAITVGAATKSDVMASFSSRGPAPRNFDLKPDLVAPGVDIISAAPGGGTLALSGTSMATPHVAGVAAQLRQLHPGWSVEQIKSALVSTAMDLGLQPFEQGAGRVDAYRAATASFAVTPTRLAYGRIDPGPPSWSRRDTLHISNLTAESRTVVFPPSTTVVSGATLTVTPATVTLPAAGTATVVAELVVDNAIVPAPTFKPYGYTTTLVAASGTEAHRIPVAFHEAATLAVPTSAFVNWILVHDRGTSGFLDTFSPIFDGPSLPLPAGNYDVMAWLSPAIPPHFPSSYVVRENVAVHGDIEIPLELEDATVLLRFENVNELGTPVACNLGVFSFHHERAPYGIANIAPFDELRVSEASAAYRLEWTRASTNFRDSPLLVQRHPGGNPILTHGLESARRAPPDHLGVPAGGGLGGADLLGVHDPSRLRTRDLCPLRSHDHPDPRAIRCRVVVDAVSVRGPSPVCREDRPGGVGGRHAGPGLDRRARARATPRPMAARRSLGGWRPCALVPPEWRPGGARTGSGGLAWPASERSDDAATGGGLAVPRGAPDHRSLRGKDPASGSGFHAEPGRHPRRLGKSDGHRRVYHRGVHRQRPRGRPLHAPHRLPSFTQGTSFHPRGSRRVRYAPAG
jgi:subtilisin family serine protease